VAKRQNQAPIIDRRSFSRHITLILLVLMAAIHRALSAGEEVTEEVWRERIIRLSERERAVLALILENLPTHAVAEQLAIGERTVQGHRWRIYQKMGLNSTDLLQQHIRKEWLSSPVL
jgi:bacterial regulatory proteins, luxR family